MNANSRIKYITHQQIDKEKWDAAITLSSNGLIYAYSFYLDNMAANWDALVLNDYEAVMPLTWNNKYTFYYLYQPLFCGSLGIFGQSLNAETTEEFLLQIPAKFRYWDISLNKANFLNTAAFKWHERKNFILNLNEPYPVLYSRFSDNIKRNIKKVSQPGYTINKPPLAEIVQLAKKQLQTFTAVTDADVRHFSNLYDYLKKRKMATTYGVVAANGELLASAVFFFWQNRAYYILAGNHPDSKTTGASHALIDTFIKDHAGNNIILDFEGSDNPGLAFFYSGFGSLQEKYPAIKYNRLPAFIKWLKK